MNLFQDVKRMMTTYLVVDRTATVLEDDLADGVGGGEEGVVGEAVGGENPVEVGHQGGRELRLWRRENSFKNNTFSILKIWIQREQNASSLAKWK